MSCRMSTREKVADCIRNMDSAMLSMPMDISRIALMARSRDTNADELARFLSHHGSLSARVLKIANSSCFGRSGDIDSLSSAIIQTGFREIVAIALCSGVFTMLSSEGKCSGVEQDRIWKHNIGAGLAANLAAKSVRAPVDGFSLLTGLLHDIGKIVFHLCLPDEYQEVLQCHQADLAPLHSLERERLGIDHGEVGYQLLMRWNFPDSVCMPIRYHHDLIKCPFEYFHQTMILHLADYLVLRARIGCSGNINPEISTGVMTTMGLSETRMDELTEKLGDMRSQVDHFLEALS